MAYNLAADIDDWAESVETATGLHVTRDPKHVNPPCIFLDMPDAVGTTLAAITCAVPVWLVAAGGGKQAADQLLEYLPEVLDAVESKSATAQPLELEGRPDGFHAYRMIANLHITEETP